MSHGAISGPRADHPVFTTPDDKLGGLRGNENVVPGDNDEQGDGDAGGAHDVDRPGGGKPHDGKPKESAEDVKPGGGEPGDAKPETGGGKPPADDGPFGALSGGYNNGATNPSPFGPRTGDGGWPGNGHHNGWDPNDLPPGIAKKLGGNDGLLANTLNGVGSLVSGLLGGNPQAAGNIARSLPDQPTLQFGGSPAGRNGQPVDGNAMGRVGQPGPDSGNPIRNFDTNPTRANGESTPRGPQIGGNPAGRGDAAPGRGAEPGAASNLPGQPAALSKGGVAAGTTQAPQQGTQAGLLSTTAQLAAAQALLNGMAGSQTLQNAQTQLAAGLPLTPEQKALLQGSLFAQAPATQQTQAQDKPLPLLPQQNAARSEAELRNLQQQVPAEAKRQAETLDRSLAKQTAEQQQTRNPTEARTTDARSATTEAQARADAKALRESADKARANLTENGKPTIGENAKNSQLANAERRPAGAAETLRQALDWVGQQVRGVGADAKTDAEGVTAMRVVAGLVIAATVVGVAIAVLYAIRIAFVS